VVPLFFNNESRFGLSIEAGFFHWGISTRCPHQIFDSHYDTNLRFLTPKIVKNKKKLSDFKKKSEQIKKNNAGTAVV
jgi:hypothetical protein